MDTYIERLVKVRRRIFEISFKYRLCHLSSSLTALPIIFDIYQKIGVGDKFILSAGHCGLALYCVLEDFLGVNAEQLYLDHGIHPKFDPERGIDCSSGSLGCALPIALGIATGNPNRKVNVMISDGECSEGSIWETLQLKKEFNADNLTVYVNINNFSAYDSVDGNDLVKRLYTFDNNIQVYFTYRYLEPFKFLRGLNGHYHVMSESDYNNALNIC